MPNIVPMYVVGIVDGFILCSELVCLAVLFVLFVLLGLKICFRSFNFPSVMSSSYVHVLGFYMATAVHGMQLWKVIIFSYVMGFGDFPYSSIFIKRPKLHSCRRWEEQLNICLMTSHQIHYPQFV